VVKRGLEVVDAVAYYKGDIIRREGLDQAKIQDFATRMRVVLNDNAVRVFVRKFPDDLLEVKTMMLCLF
jgi:hypothetical protein